MTHIRTLSLALFALCLSTMATSPALADGKAPTGGAAATSASPRREHAANRSVEPSGADHSSPDASPDRSERSSRPRRVLHGVVNLNQADEATLEMLPGIGEVKAGRILSWRQSHAFKKPEDLDRVKGFGRKTVTRLKPYLSVSGPTTLSDEMAAPSSEQ